MTALPLLALVLCATGISASPRNLAIRGQGRDASPGGDSGPPGYSKDEPWGSTTDGWGDSSQYGGSWGHSSTAVHPGSQYGGGGGGGGGWGHSSTCGDSTVVEISTVAGPASTVYISGSDLTEILPASTVHISGSDHTSTVVIPASTVYISGSAFTKTLPALTVYISGSDHTSYVPASTLTIAGPVETSVSTIYGTLTRPAVPTTVFVTHNGPGWNRTVTHEQTDVVTTTQYEVSTLYDEETTTVTSAVTLPGRSLGKASLKAIF